MQITPVKPLLTNVRPADPRKMCSFCIQTPLLGEVNLTGRLCDDYGFSNFIIEIYNKFKKRLGHELLSMYRNYDNFCGLFIEIEPEYRHSELKDFRLGELLRLASVILMKENKKKEFQIYSKDTAVYFHSKYKFEPDITSFNNRDLILATILKQKEFNDLAHAAENLLYKIRQAYEAEEQRALCKPANVLIKEYIDRVILSGTIDKHPFPTGMNMVLTDKNLSENKEFFNKLYEKHGIDYKL